MGYTLIDKRNDVNMFKTQVKFHCKVLNILPASFLWSMRVQSMENLLTSIPVEVSGKIVCEKEETNCTTITSLSLFLRSLIIALDQSTREKSLSYC